MHSCLIILLLLLLFFSSVVPGETSLFHSCIILLLCSKFSFQHMNCNWMLTEWWQMLEKWQWVTVTMCIYWLGEAKQQSCTVHVAILTDIKMPAECIFKLNSLSLSQHINKQQWGQRKKATELTHRKKRSLVAKDKYLKQKYQQNCPENDDEIFIWVDTG